MKLDIEEMSNELIRLAYERRNKKYDIGMTEAEKKQRFKDLYEERDYIEKMQVPDLEDIRDSFKWQKVQAEIYGLKMECMDPDLCRKVLEYKIASSEDIEFEYVQKMADGEIQFDEDVVRHFVEYIVNEDFIIGNKEFLMKAIKATGESLLLASLADEDTIKDILSDADFMKKILGKEDEESSNFLSGIEELDVIIKQLIRCKSLYNNKEFMMQFIDNIIHLDDKLVNENVLYTIIELIKIDFLACYELFNDLDLREKMFKLLENGTYSDDYEPYQIISSRFIIEDICDEELAYRYCRIFENVNCISKELLENREFFLSMLDKIHFFKLDIPKKYLSDAEVIEKYFSSVEEPYIDSISIEVLNNERIANKIKEVYGIEPNTLFLNEIAERIEKTGKVATHYGDDLDNKAAIEAIQRWGEENDYIRIGHPLKVTRVPAGSFKEGVLNVDTGGHKGSSIICDKSNEYNPNDTIVIDGDTEHGVKSACEALSRLGIYVPEQIVELADTKSNKVSSLDSRSGLALVRYLTGSQVFELAEAELLDKSLTDEQLEEYGLTEVHQKQQEIIDNAVTKIEKYTQELPNGEKIVLAPEQILAGSSIAYEKGINYYVSSSQHFDSQGIPDGVTFAITCKPGVKLPEEILEYGRKLEEIYKTGENTSNVFVHPNNQMIVAGGVKNPEFKIAGGTAESILNNIFEIFSQKEKQRI